MKMYYHIYKDKFNVQEEYCFQHNIFSNKFSYGNWSFKISLDQQIIIKLIKDCIIALIFIKA